MNRLSLVLLGILAILTPISIRIIREKTPVPAVLGLSGDSRIIELYDARLEAAKLNLKTSELRQAHAKTRYQSAVKLQQKGYTSLEDLREKKLDYDHACAEVEHNKAAIKMAEAQLALVRAGVANGLIGIENLDFPIEPLTPQRR